MAKRFPCEVWVLIAEQCAPPWPGLGRESGNVLELRRDSRQESGTICHLAQFRNWVMSFLMLARVHRSLRAAMEVVCQHYFQTHCGPIKSSKHTTWTRALGRVFEIMTTRQRMHSGKLLLAGVPNDVRKSLHFSSLNHGTHDVYSMCTKLFDRGLSHLVQHLVGNNLRRGWLCLPQLIKHQMLLQQKEPKPEWFKPFTEKYGGSYYFEDLPDYSTVQELAKLIREYPVMAEEYLCRCIEYCGKNMLIDMLDKCFKTNLKDSLLIVTCLLKDDALWTLWTTEWWKSFAGMYTYFFEMEALVKCRPEITGLTYENTRGNHSIIGHVLPVHTALTVPDWRCQPNISYEKAVASAIIHEDEESLERLIVERGLVVTGHNANWIQAWLDSLGRPSQIKSEHNMVATLECLFRHGYILSVDDVADIKDNLDCLPVSVSITLLRAIIQQGLTGIWGEDLFIDVI